MARVRAWAIRAIVVVLLVWPPIHHVLTRVHGMNPWYFFGWAMYAAPPDHVVVVITHEVERLAGFDRVVFLDGGRVCGAGAHDELLATNAQYARCCRPHERGVG